MPMSQAMRRPRRRIFIGYGIRKIAAIGLLLSNLWGTDPVQAQASDATLRDATLQELAQAALAAHQYETAATLWQAIVHDHPDDASAYYYLGLSLHAQDRLDEAMTAYQTALRLNPQYDAPYVNLGLILISLGNLERAKPLFQEVLQLPDRPEVPASVHTIAHYNLAIIEKRTDHTEAALSEVQLALAITPDFALAQQLLEQLRSGQRD